MKKLFISLIAAIALANAANAQSRNCGTTEYLEIQKQKNPTLQKTMEENERKLQDYIKKHSNTTSFPSLQGFKPTGNQKQDEINYANAKSEYLKYTGFGNTHQPIDETKVNAQREEKRKSKSFTQK